MPSQSCTPAPAGGGHSPHHLCPPGNQLQHHTGLPTLHSCASPGALGCVPCIPAQPLSRGGNAGECSLRPQDRIRIQPENSKPGTQKMRRSPGIWAVNAAWGPGPAPGSLTPWRTGPSPRSLSATEGLPSHVQDDDSLTFFHTLGVPCNVVILWKRVGVGETCSKLRHMRGGQAPKVSVTGSPLSKPWDAGKSDRREGSEQRPWECVVGRGPSPPCGSSRSCLGGFPAPSLSHPHSGATPVRSRLPSTWSLKCPNLSLAAQTIDTAALGGTSIQPGLLSHPNPLPGVPCVPCACPDLSSSLSTITSLSLRRWKEPAYQE